MLIYGTSSAINDDLFNMNWTLVFIGWWMPLVWKRLRSSISCMGRIRTIGITNFGWYSLTLLNLSTRSSLRMSFWGGMGWRLLWRSSIVHMGIHWLWVHPCKLSYLADPYLRNSMLLTRCTISWSLIMGGPSWVTRSSSGFVFLPPFSSSISSSDLSPLRTWQVVQILSSRNSLLNVCRPATAILKRLVEADPRFAPGPAVGPSNSSSANGVGKGVYRYGFNIVFEQMRREPDLLETVVGRLASADSVMALNRWVSIVRCDIRDGMC